MTKKTRTKDVERSAASGRFSVAKSAKPSADNQTIARSARTGRFADGVKAIGRRDNAGLIKLADR